MNLPDPPAGLNWPRFQPGWVWLVGAGPGDPGLLTLHGLNGLAQADIVVHDALVGRDILAWAPQAEHIFAGKRGGKPSPRQADITLRLIELARAGKRVLRLKGGDPFIFGRGGEEAQALIAAGIPVRVVPGISAGIGGLAYAGIPATHRQTNQSVTFVTGHDQTGQAPSSLDWQAISRSSEVIILYMALKHIGVISAALLAAGRPADDPVAVVSDATLPGQQVLHSTLGTCAADIARAGIEPPAVMCIGPAMALTGLIAGFTP